MSETRSAKAPTAAKVPTAKAKFAEIVLVCRKCARRQGLTRKEARTLAKAGYEAGYRAGRGAAHPEDGGRKGPKPRIVESGCLGPCPKRMLAVATGASVAAGRVLLLDPRGGTAFPELGRGLGQDLGQDLDQDPTSRRGPDFGPNATLGARPGDQPATDRGAPA